MSLILTQMSRSSRGWRRSSSPTRPRSRTSWRPRGKLCPRFVTVSSSSIVFFLSKQTHLKSSFYLLCIKFQDIFDDFTEHWVASSPHRAKSVDSLDSSERSDQGSVTRTPRTPNTRKEHRDGHRGTRIPAPTYYRGQQNAKTQ